MKPEEIQALVDEAVAVKTDELRDEIEAKLRREQDIERGDSLNKAIKEGVQLYMDPGSGYEFAIIPLDKIDYNPVSRRSEEELDPESEGIKELQEQIKSKGGLLRFPLVYRKNDRYVLVKGARRIAALRGLEEELIHAWILPGKPPMDMEERWVNGY